MTIDREATIRADKAGLRRELRTARERVDADQAVKWSEAIQERVLALPFVDAAETLHTFVGALRGEVQTRALVEQWLRSGKRVVCPRVEGADGVLGHYAISSLDELVESKMGLWEPDPGRCRRVGLDELDVVITPGLGFDREGHRLGLGGGYYDRLLASGTPSVGLAFGLQVVERIPHEAHDVPVDWLVTEQGVTDCRKGRAG